MPCIINLNSGKQKGISDEKKIGKKKKITNGTFRSSSFMRLLTIRPQNPDG